MADRSSSSSSSQLSLAAARYCARIKFVICVLRPAALPACLQVVCQMAGLEQLILSLNSMQALPPAISALTNLQWL